MKDTAHPEVAVEYEFDCRARVRHSTPRPVRVFYGFQSCLECCRVPRGYQAGNRCRTTVPAVRCLAACATQSQPVRRDPKKPPENQDLADWRTDRPSDARSQSCLRSRRCERPRKMTRPRRLLQSGMHSKTLVRQSFRRRPVAAACAYRGD